MSKILRETRKLNGSDINLFFLYIFRKIEYAVSIVRAKCLLSNSEPVWVALRSIPHGTSAHLSPSQIDKRTGKSRQE